MSEPQFLIEKLPCINAIQRARIQSEVLFRTEGMCLWFRLMFHQIRESWVRSWIPRTLFPGGFAANPCMFEKAPNPIFFGHLSSIAPGSFDKRVRHVPTTMLEESSVIQKQLLAWEDGLRAADLVVRHVETVDPIADPAVQVSGDEQGPSYHSVERTNDTVGFQERKNTPDNLECCGTHFKTQGAKRYAIPSIPNKNED